jgi:hypothetical protein
MQSIMNEQMNQWAVSLTPSGRQQYFMPERLILESLVKNYKQSAVGPVDTQRKAERRLSFPGFVYDSLP